MKKTEINPSEADALDAFFDKPHVAETLRRPEDCKASVKSLQFDLKSKESRKMFVGLVDELHQQSVLFSLKQDFNLVWVEL